MACHLFKAAAVCAALACGFPSAGHGAEQPLSLTVGAGGTWNADWTGGAGEADHRVFFFQWSVNLTDWHYASFMDFGPGLKSHGIDTGGAPKFFARLLYFDFPELESLEQAEEEDFDGDGLSTIAELEDHATDPFLWDSDGDWLPDNFEVENGLDPNDDGGIDPSNGRDGDPDADGLSNFDEWWHGSDPHDPDSDGDMLSDGDEVHLHHSSPALSDSDLDGLDDHAEVMTHGTDPANADTDDDTLSDYEEVVTHGTNPLDIDTDADWMWDDFEVANPLDPLDPADGLADADGDGLVNKLEFVFMDLGQEPFTADAANFSWTGDPDGDGLTTLLEFNSLNLHPRRHDTDADAMGDGWENQHAAHGFDPRTDNATDGDPDNDASADPDNDNLTNEQESALGTNPKNPDTDGDGVNDDVENTQGTNPLDPNDHLPPPQGTVAVHVTFGDHSSSHSEKYQVFMQPLEGDTQERKRTNRRFGQVQTDTFHVPKGAKYEVTLKHLETSDKYRGTPRPDHDYTLKFQWAAGAHIVIRDDDGILGVHGTDGHDFFAAGKAAYLHVPLFEWVTPKGSPVSAPDDSGDGQNEFTYNTASPGVLTLDLKVLVKPTGTAGLTGHDAVKFSDRCVFALPSISGSDFEWDAANPGGKSNASGDHLLAKATYTTLPASNSEFGKKEAEFKCDNDSNVLAKGDFEVFFPKHAKNHPELGPHLMGRPPNWFYYWREGGVCSIPLNAQFDEATAAYGYVYPGVDTILRLGAPAAETNSGPETFTGPSGSITVTGNGKGIKCVVETVTHELHHLTLHAILGSKTDTDGDGIADSDEPSLDGVSTDPADGDSYELGVYFGDPPGTGYHLYGDDEVRCRKVELTPLPHYENLDWANPGCQSKTKFGP